MEKKFSTGKLGRLKKHTSDCKDIIRAINPGLAEEYIKNLDPDYSDTTWQQYQTVEECALAFRSWLKGGEVTPEKPNTTKPTIADIKNLIKSSSDDTIPLVKLNEIIENTIQWYYDQKNQEELGGLDEPARMEYTLGRIKILAGIAV